MTSALLPNGAKVGQRGLVFILESIREEKRKEWADDPQALKNLDFVLNSLLFSQEGQDLAEGMTWEIERQVKALREGR